jgi:pyruvate/2-oxoglutarate dehydrogenase complex dihydrolipoamide acyltransferase (E2) component
MGKATPGGINGGVVVVRSSAKRLRAARILAAARQATFFLPGCQPAHQRARFDACLPLVCGRKTSNQDILKEFTMNKLLVASLGLFAASVFAQATPATPATPAAPAAAAAAPAAASAAPAAAAAKKDEKKPAAAAAAKKPAEKK